MMGVLAGIEDATGFDLRDCDYYVGTSAGAIVATHLAAGQSTTARKSRKIKSQSIDSPNATLCHITT